MCQSVYTLQLMQKKVSYFVVSRVIEKFSVIMMIHHFVTFSDHHI